MKTLSRHSIGTGDRFAHQAEAQLKAIQKINDEGTQVDIVWNKSFREHKLTGTIPSEVGQAALKAVKKLGYKGKYFVDADHINLSNVDLFTDSSNFFTLDVAEMIGEKAEEKEIEAFLEANGNLLGEVSIGGLDEGVEISPEKMRNIAEKYLLATQEAKAIYQKILSKRPSHDFVVEVSMDETEEVQSCEELLIILKMLSDQDIPFSTIAPKFPGRFNKGIDYQGDLNSFDKGFRSCLGAIEYAKEHFGVSHDLKISVHSGSDKFSIYPIMRQALRDFEAGLHIKTAGTSWLEELIGLAEATSLEPDNKAFDLVKYICHQALCRYDELCQPYQTVIDIDYNKLPGTLEIDELSSEKFIKMIRHEKNEPLFNKDLRQLLHLSYKIAAEMEGTYTDALKANREVIGKNVYNNIYQRHLVPLFRDL